MADVNVNMLMKSLAPAARAVQGLAFGAAKVIVNKTTEKFLRQDFDNHPVTKELAQPNPETKTSSFLPYGNLFSFLGFYKGTDLISPIQEKIYYGTNPINNPKFSSNKNKYIFSFPVHITSMAEIEDQKVAPHPPEWDSRSWVRVLEDGIPGFAFYIYKKIGFPDAVSSRSTTGLQKKRNQSFGSIGPIKYISSLLNLLKERIEART